MRQPTVRIYLTANLITCLLFMLTSLPEGLGFGLIVSVLSILFSSPTLLVLYGCFSLLKHHRPSLTNCWLLLLVAVSICACIPILLGDLYLTGELLIDKEFLLLSFGCAFTGTLLQGFYINKYFKSLHHQTSFTNENN